MVLMTISYVKKIMIIIIEMEVDKQNKVKTGKTGEEEEEK